MLTDRTIPQAFQRAQALHRAGRSDEALALYSQILMARPDTPQVHYQVGRLHAAGGRTEKAVAAFAKALAGLPGEKAVWQSFLAALPAEGAQAALAPALKAAGAGTVAARAAHGTALWSLRRSSLAEPLLRSAEADGAEVALRPLAELLAETGRPDEAEARLAALPKKTPEDWQALARLRARLRRPGPAQEALQKAGLPRRDRVRARSDLAETLSQENETGAALAVMGDLVRSLPNAAGPRLQRAQMYQSLGDFDRADEDLARAMALEPANGEVYRAWCGARKVAADDPVLERMQAALRADGEPPESRLRLHFALAKALFDLGRDDEAFDRLDEANGMQRALVPYDFDADVVAARQMFTAFRRHLAVRTPEGPEDLAIFVTGLPRSGTTLVETIFAAHSAVTAGGEMGYLREALSPAMDALSLGLPPGDGAFGEAGARYLALARRHAGTDGAFTDKAIGTFTRIGHAALALPGARFFVLDRDPRDVGLSLYRNLFREGLHRFSNDLRDIGRYIRLMEAIVAAWETLLPGLVRRVGYDALTADPATEIPALVADAGLPWEEACLAPHKAERRVETLSFAQVRQPIYRTSVEGWRRFEHRLGPLAEGLETRVEVL
ncbi:tetratricopeptide repeat protein [Rhodobacterales bacterium HKCCE2091]|nr:tetratricopeptide repeat protein [Rhodobacterales bacterium HKCCE2091]